MKAIETRAKGGRGIRRRSVEVQGNRWRSGQEGWGKMQREEERAWVE